MKRNDIHIIYTTDDDDTTNHEKLFLYIYDECIYQKQSNDERDENVEVFHFKI